MEDKTAAGTFGNTMNDGWDSPANSTALATYSSDTVSEKKPSYKLKTQHM